MDRAEEEDAEEEGEIPRLIPQRPLKMRLQRALLRAALGGDAQRVWAVLERRDHLVDSISDDGRTVLTLAVTSGCPETVFAVLAANPDLHKKAYCGSSAVTTCIDIGDVPVMRVLLEYGPLNPDSRTKGYTLLAWAAMQGRQRIVVLLLEAGARADQLDDRTDWSPLMFAVCNGNLRVVRALLAHGINLSGSLDASRCLCPASVLPPVGRRSAASSASCVGRLLLPKRVKRRCRTGLPISGWQMGIL